MPRVKKIATLPEELRLRLQQALVQSGGGDIVAITAELNAWLAAEGIDETIGKSAVGEEAKRIKRLQENIHVATETARLLGNTSRDDADVRGEAIMATVQTDIWHALVQLREADTIKDPMDRLKALTKAASSVGELSRARVNQSKWRTDVDARVKAAEEKVTKLARQGGMDAKTVEAIRSQILGITARTAAAPAAA
jgi:chaperonin cofactor prefoldin